MPSVLATAGRQQELTEWLSERLARLELLAEHTLSVVSNAESLLQTELASIREARLRFDL